VLSANGHRCAGAEFQVRASLPSGDRGDAAVTSHEVGGGGRALFSFAVPGFFPPFISGRGV